MTNISIGESVRSLMTGSFARSKHYGTASVFLDKFGTMSSAYLEPSLDGKASIRIISKLKTDGHFGYSFKQCFRGDATYFNKQQQYVYSLLLQRFERYLPRYINKVVVVDYQYDKNKNNESFMSMLGFFLNYKYAYLYEVTFMRALKEYCMKRGIKLETTELNYQTRKCMCCGSILPVQTGAQSMKSMFCDLCTQNASIENTYVHTFLPYSAGTAVNILKDCYSDVEIENLAVNGLDTSTKLNSLR